MCFLFFMYYYRPAGSTTSDYRHQQRKRLCKHHSKTRGDHRAAENITRAADREGSRNQPTNEQTIVGPAHQIVTMGIRRLVGRQRISPCTQGDVLPTVQAVWSTSDRMNDHPSPLQNASARVEGLLQAPNVLRSFPRVSTLR